VASSKSTPGILRYQKCRSRSPGLCAGHSSLSKIQVSWRGSTGRRPRAGSAQRLAHFRLGGRSCRKKAARPHVDAFATGATLTFDGKVVYAGGAWRVGLA